MVAVQKSVKQLEDEDKPEVKAPEVLKAAPEVPAQEPDFVYGEKLDRLLDPVPAHWCFVPGEGSAIVATCSTNGDVFRGTVAEFNKALRAS